jgi:hypothetical protein
MREQIYVVHWEGPFLWEDRDKHITEDHVLYAIYGSHHLYGRDVLLYIGKTESDLRRRLAEHETWVQNEYDAMTVRFASVGLFKNWDDWEEGERYPAALPDVVQAVEALLIYTNQPAYNSKSKATIKLAEGFRIFNTGRLGHILPEVS